MKLLFLNISQICSLLLIANITYGQNDFLTLARTWQFDKSSIRGTVMSPSDIEKQDYLDLRDDFTFIRVDGGTCFQGKWEYDESNQKIKLTYQLIDKVDFFSVKAVDKTHLVLKVEEDWKNEMTLYMKAVKYPCSI
ncbi:MAG: hypothetical protein CMO01_16525 [Thalassobius sp.]|nr:hypothetical protein [Thalassovita sp.]